jgi:penicillin-binding protein 1B
MPRRRKARKKKSSPRKHSGFPWFKLTLTLVFVTAVYVFYLDFRVRHEFEGKRWELPARVYAQSTELYAGMPVDAAALAALLTANGYLASIQSGVEGIYYQAGDGMRLRTRAFDFWDGHQPSMQVEVQFAGGSIATLRHIDSGRRLDLLRLDPLQIGSFYPSHHEDRVLVQLAEVPPLLVKAIIATEDRHFYSHHGVSLRAIARALWANLRAGATVQGGSTLTQQLVKNFYLTQERSLWRKANEAVMALLLEYHYDKDDILEAYLNEIYLGQDRERAIHGFGLASQFYFGKPVADLDLPRAALLVALVRGASYYNPRRHPQRARKRRNLVITALVDQGYISADAAKKAMAAPLGVTAAPPAGSSSHPAFLDLVKRQLRRDYREEDLTTEGLRVFTTLKPQVQQLAGRRFVAMLQRLERERRLPDGTLEGAVVITNSSNGEVLAMIGGRKLRYTGFNRVLDARRPVGSLIKPAVYLTALQQPGRYNVLSRLDDSPLEITLDDGDTWSPQNFDKTFRDKVYLFDALSHSVNVPTVRLGLDIGVDKVVTTLRRLGIERPMHSYPSLLLGAEEFSPLEILQIYQTLAGGGFRTPLRAIHEVADARGQPLQRYPLRIEQAFEAAPVYLVNRILQQVVERGTARALAAQMPAAIRVAGKTGTTDGLRDSWFAGFTGDRVAVVWVGRDDNSPTGLTGSSGALRVWGSILSALQPQPLLLTPPANVQEHSIDLDSGLLDGRACKNSIDLPFVSGSEPTEHAPCAGGAARDTLDRVFDWFKGDR